MTVFKKSCATPMISKLAEMFIKRSQEMVMNQNLIKLATATVMKVWIMKSSKTLILISQKESVARSQQPLVMSSVKSSTDALHPV